jgi:signal transduction histidine kinase
LPSVQADPDQLRIVFANLVRNAREAMPEGGTLSLTGRRDDGQVEVLVADTGTGISTEHLSRIMEPLYTTKARGLGLGLALARVILEKSKGTLKATSLPGQGSTFFVRLMAAE